MDIMDRVQKEDLLLEIGCEELPSRYIPGALERLEEKAALLFKEHRLSFEGSKSWGTPRRLALLVSGLASRQPDLQKKVKGPALERAYDTAGSPTAALLVATPGLALSGLTGNVGAPRSAVALTTVTLAAHQDLRLAACA